MGTKGSQPFLLATREGFLEEAASELSLERHGKEAEARWKVWRTP